MKPSMLQILRYEPGSRWITEEYLNTEHKFWYDRLLVKLIKKKLNEKESR